MNLRIIVSPSFIFDRRCREESEQPCIRDSLLADPGEEVSWLATVLTESSILLDPCMSVDVRLSES